MEEFYGASVHSDVALTDENIDQWIAAQEGFGFDLSTCFKNGKGGRAVTEDEAVELAEMILKDLDINANGFEERFGVAYDNVDWIQPAVKDCRDLVNEMNGVTE
ncbi:MAG: hypothetical protein IJY90_02520 [Clostridia bacterium]|nr:hypothetical protein [Clostridia bacterium]